MASMPFLRLSDLLLIQFSARSRTLISSLAPAGRFAPFPLAGPGAKTQGEGKGSTAAVPAS